MQGFQASLGNSGCDHHYSKLRRKSTNWCERRDAEGRTGVNSDRDTQIKPWPPTIAACSHMSVQKGLPARPSRNTHVHISHPLPQRICEVFASRSCIARRPWPAIECRLQYESRSCSHRTVVLQDGHSRRTKRCRHHCQRASSGATAASRSRFHGSW